MIALTWVLAAVSLVGTVANVRGRWWGFGLWVVADAGWVAVAVARGSVPEAVLWGTYTGLAVWGMVAWRRRRSPQRHGDTEAETKHEGETHGKI